MGKSRGSDSHIPPAGILDGGKGHQLATRAVQRRSGQAHSRVSELIARNERSLMRIAQHWSLCRDDALDAYQRALEIYLRRIDSLDPATEIAWLKVVAIR